MIQEHQLSKISLVKKDTWQSTNPVDPM